MHADAVGVDVGAGARFVQRRHQVERVLAAPIAEHGAGEIRAVGGGAAGIDEQHDVTRAGDDLVQRVEAAGEDAVRPAVDLEYERPLPLRREAGRKDQPAGDFQPAALDLELLDAPDLARGRVLRGVRGQLHRIRPVRRPLLLRVVPDRLRPQLRRALRRGGRKDGAGDPLAGLAGDVQISDHFVFRPIRIMLAAVLPRREIGDRAVPIRPPGAEPAPIDVVDARRPVRIGRERGLLADQPHPRRRADREEAALRVERIIVQPCALARRRIDEADVGVVPLLLVRDRHGELVFVRVVGIVP